MKKTLLVFMLFILSACSPSEAVIQTAIAKTQAAQPANTAQPTKTPVKKTTYIVTVGNCLGYETRYIPTGDPVGFEFCSITERQQTAVASNESAEIEFSSFSPYKYPSYCAVHTLDGEYVTSNVDSNGLGKAVCVINP